MVCSCFKLNHWKCLCGDHVTVLGVFYGGGDVGLIVRVKWMMCISISISMAASKLSPAKLPSHIGTGCDISLSLPNKSKLIIVISSSLSGEN